MKHDQGDWVFYLLRLIGDVILISLFQTILKNSMHITEKARKVLLIVLAASLFLAVLAFARNVKTMFMYMNAQNVMFLLADVAQVILYAWVWSKFYFKTAFTKLEAIIATVLFILSSIMNTYLFVQNFWWLESEGLNIFGFWFIQNGDGILIPFFLYFVITNFKISQS